MVLPRLADEQMLRVEASNQADATWMVLVSDPDAVVRFALDPDKRKLLGQIEKRLMHASEPRIDERVSSRELGCTPHPMSADTFTVVDEFFECTDERGQVVDLAQGHACAGIWRR